MAKAASPTALIVDDSATVRAVLRSQLDQAGWQTILAASGEEAIAAAASHRIDVVLLDLRMSGMDGWATLDALAADPVRAFAPVVIFSEAGDDTTVADGLARGAYDFVRKSAPTAELLARLSAALRTKRLVDELRASAEVRGALLSEGPVEEALGLICQQACELVGAEGALIASGPPDDRRVLALVGADQASLVGLAAELSRAGHAGAGRDVATVAIPLDAEPDAMLLATRPALPFARAEVVILDGLAQHAALAIELSRSRDEHDRLTVVTDRERIARELHDRVIQSLFAAGMGLESCLRLVPTGEAAARIRRSIDELDRAISELRSAIFQTRPATRAGAGLRHRLLELVAGGGNQTGEPNLTFEGPVDALPRDVQRHVLMLAHEGLVRLREQQAAGGLDLTVQAVDGSARIVFRTDRPGPGWQATVEQLAAHVAARGGEMEAASEPAGRARIEVRVPRPSGA